MNTETTPETTIEQIEAIFLKSVESALKFHEEDPENSCGLTIDISDNFGFNLTRPKEGMKSLFGTLPEPTDSEVENHFSITTSDILKYSKHIGLETDTIGNIWGYRRGLAYFRSDQYITKLIQRDLLKYRM